jgi:uncharacterized protein (DUF3084 family)
MLKRTTVSERAAVWAQ